MCFCRVRCRVSGVRQLLEVALRIGPFAHTCASVVGISMDPPVVVGRDWSPGVCPLTKPVVAAVEQQATTELHCSRGVQPGGIYVYVVQRELTPGGPGSGVGLAPRPQASASCASCRSAPIYICFGRK